MNEVTQESQATATNEMLYNHCVMVMAYLMNERGFKMQCRLNHLETWLKVRGECWEQAVKETENWFTLQGNKSL